MTAPSVILLVGPAGAGKTTTAARIAEHPAWVHLSEDDLWVAIKLGRPPGEPRTRAEQDVVLERMTERLLEVVARDEHAVLELILYEDPPRPLLHYQRALEAAGIEHVTRALRPDVDEIVRRIAERGRPGDADAARVRANVEHQAAVLASTHIDPRWIVDTTGVDLEGVYARWFAPLVEA